MSAPAWAITSRPASERDQPAERLRHQLRREASGPFAAAAGSPSRAELAEKLAAEVAPLAERIEQALG